MLLTCCGAWSLSRPRLGRQDPPANSQNNEFSCLISTNQLIRISSNSPRYHSIFLFPQQRKLRGSSAQNSSGVHWCRRHVQQGSGFGAEQVRFNKVPEKVLEKVPEKVWEALVQSQVRFNRVPEKFPEKVPGSLGAKPSQVQQGSRKGSGEGREALVQSSGRCSTGFQRRFRRRSPEKVCNGRLWCRASTGFRRRFRRRFREALVQSKVKFNRSGEGSGEGLGGFGAKPGVVQVNKVLEKVPEKAPGGFGAEWGQVQQGSRKTWCKAKSSSTGSGEGSEGLGGSTGFRRRFRRRLRRRLREALVQSQVRFNRVLEKVSEKAPGGFGAEPGQVQQGSGEVSGEGCRSQARSGSFNSWKISWMFPALGFPARFRKICKNKMLRLLGIPPKLIRNL